MNVGDVAPGFELLTMSSQAVSLAGTLDGDRRALLLFLRRLGQLPCLCTFPDKPTATAEMARVLRSPEPARAASGGWLGLTDLTVSETLPEEIESLLAWVAY